MHATGTGLIRATISITIRICLTAAAIARVHVVVELERVDVLQEAEVVVEVLLDDLLVLFDELGRGRLRVLWQLEECVEVELTQNARRALLLGRLRLRHLVLGCDGAARELRVLGRLEAVALGEDGGLLERHREEEEEGSRSTPSATEVGPTPECSEGHVISFVEKMRPTGRK